MSNTETIIPGLREHYGELLKDVPSGHPNRTSDCPSLSRLKRIAEDPSLATDTEQAHMGGCKYCTTAIEQFKKAIAEQA